jgi:hypothetical protein
MTRKVEVILFDKNTQLVLGLTTILTPNRVIMFKLNGMVCYLLSMSLERITFEEHVY